MGDLNFRLGQLTGAEIHSKIRELEKSSDARRFECLLQYDEVSFLAQLQFFGLKNFSFNK